MWRSSFPAMGTRVDIIGWGGEGMAIVNAIVEVVARHEDLWSVFRPSSEVSRLNSLLDHTAEPSRDGTTSVGSRDGLVVSEETDRLLRCALALAEATGGAFNPMIGPLVAAWDVKSMRAAYVAGAPIPPAPDARVIEAARTASSPKCLTRIGERLWALSAPHGGANAVRAAGDGTSRGHVSGTRASAESAAISVNARDERDHRDSGRVAGAAIDSDAGAPAARSSREASGISSRPRVDLGGIAKGYTADACRDLAVNMGARGVLVSVGTSSVSVYGTRSDAMPWRAGMQDPSGVPTRVADVIELPADGMASLSTSGDNLGPLGGPVHGGDGGDVGVASAVFDAADVPAPATSPVELAPALPVAGAVPSVAGSAGSGRPAFAAPRVPYPAGRADGLVFASGACETSRETSELGARLLSHHIIDPRTGYSASAGVRQVSVVATSGVLAEALSTALLVNPSIDVDDVVARWSRASGTPASARVVGLARAVQS